MTTNERTGSLGFEDKLWNAADLLRKHGYPPDKQADAVATVIEQAERVCKDWARAA